MSNFKLRNINEHSATCIHESFGRKGLIFFLLATLFCAIGTDLTHAKTTVEHQSLNSIRHTIDTFVNNMSTGEVSVIIGKIDPRLKLRKCASALNAELPPKTALLGKLSIRVSCSAPKAWKIFVPVNISRTETVIASAAPLPRNHVITKQDISPKITKITSSRQMFYTNAESVVGMRVRYPVAAGEILSPKKLKAPLLIKRGQIVTIQANTPALQVRMQGKALSDGSRGQTIRVRNLSSNRVVEGVVARRGVVQIPM